LLPFAFHELTVANDPLKFTAPPQNPKFDPEIVIGEPTAPGFGEMPVILGAGGMKFWA
jgi:hypothetical protein